MRLGQLSPNQLAPGQKWKVNAWSRAWWKLCSGWLKTSSVVHWVAVLNYLTFPCSHPCCDFEVFPIKGAVCISLFFDVSSVCDLLCPLERDVREALLVMTLDIKRACVFPLPFSISVISMRRSCPVSLLVVEGNECHLEQSQTTPAKSSLHYLSPADPQTREQNKCLLYAAELLGCLLCSVIRAIELICSVYPG